MFDFLIVVSKHKRPLSDGSLSQFINCKIDGVAFEYKTAQWILSERRDRFALFCTNDAPQKHVAAGESIRFFDGMIFQDECINDIRKLSSILGNNADHSDVFGRYVYGELQETDLSHIHRDVLGYASLVIGFGADVTAISNNPTLCAQAAHGKNYKSHKNAAALVQIGLMGATQDLSTSFHDVFFVPQNAGILIDKENKVSFYSLVDKMYYPMSQEEWDLQFEKTRQTCVKLLSKGNIQKGSITGGYDSRATLALAIEAGVHKNIQFNVRGYGDHPDVVIAKQITDYYGLQLEHHEAIVAGNENQDAFIEQSFNNALRASYNYSGMREFFENWAVTQKSKTYKNAFFVEGVQPKPNDAYQMSANGAAVETFRGYFSLHRLLQKNKPNKVMNSGDREFLINDKIKKGILSEDIYAALYYKLKRHFESYEDLYSYDLNLMRTRIPQFHAGLNNRSDFSIGFNPWLHRLSMIQAPELRAGGQIVFKLIEKSMPELLYFPFAEKTWHPYAYAGNKNEARLRQIKPCANLNKRPLPSMMNVINQMKFLFDRGFQLHDEIWKVYDEKYLSGLINDAKKVISENIMTNLWAPARLISIYGTSLFLDNKELPVAQNENSCRLELKNPIMSNIYTPPASTHITDAETICLRGDLLFSREPVFRASDHNHLTDFQKQLLEMIKVSVIIPVYNAEKYLKQCLDSVINQTFKDIEIICVNDGSADGSLEILKEYEKEDSRIKIIDQKNQGAGAARNNGLNAAKGQYVYFLDGDDFIELNALEILYEKTSSAKADIAMFPRKKFDTAAQKISIHNPFNKMQEGAVFSHKNTSADIFNIVTATIWDKFFRLAFIRDNDIRFMDLETCNDVYFAWCSAIKAEKIVYVNAPLITWRQNQKTSISGSRGKNWNCPYKAYSKIKDDLSEIFSENNVLKESFFRRGISYFSWEYQFVSLENRQAFRDNVKTVLPEKFYLEFLKNATKISVIIPVYNVEKYLRQCLDSVVNQTLGEIEIICINDGSTDASLEILREYAAKDKRIIVLDQKNSGQGTARNNGLAIAKGEYIGFVDSDDRISVDFCQVLYDAAKTKNADIAATGNAVLFGNAYAGNNKDMGFDKPAVLKTINEKKNLAIKSGVVWNKIYKKELIEKNKIAFSPSKCIGEDTIFNIIAVAAAKIIVCTMQCTYFYRKRIDSSVISRDVKDLYITDIYKNILSQLSELGLPCQWNKITYERMHLDFGYNYRDFNNELRKEFLAKIEKYFPDLQFRKFAELQYRELIVSLTSYPARIATVHMAVKSLLSQTKKADKVILWLAQEQFPNKEADLPEELTDLTQKGLTISWCEDIKSYKKLIPSLKEYPDSIIVTADDDNIYSKSWLEKLYLAYLKNPQMVHCRRAHLITFEKGRISPYQKWRQCVSNVRPSFLNFFTGVGGVLYPPNVFYKDIANKELFMNLCPYGDDIWFWAMCAFNNVKINIIKNNDFKQNTIKGTDDTALWRENILQGRNDEQLKKLFEKYPELLKKIESEYKIQKIKSLLTLKWLYGEYKEPNHKVFRVLGLKIKIRNDKRDKMKKFFKNLINVYNDGDYKVFAFLFICVKVKNKHKILLNAITQQQNHIAILNGKLSSLNKDMENLKNQMEDLKKQYGVSNAKI
ncbi:MAG: glycosyltransferase [Endomicrobia bacterium]|nr:glycosyltransferase [Endomicrobiia bacterium]